MLWALIRTTGFHSENEFVINLWVKWYKKNNFLNDLNKKFYLCRPNLGEINIIN